MKRFSIICLLAVIALMTLALPAPAPAQDLLTNLDLRYVIAPVTGSEDVTSSAISTANYRTSLLGFYSTANASWTAEAKLDFIMTECATSNGTFTPVLPYAIRGATPDENGVIFTLDEATAAATLEEIQYVGRMPYFKIKADFTGVTNVATPTISVFSVDGGKIISGN